MRGRPRCGGRCAEHGGRNAGFYRSSGPTRQRETGRVAQAKRTSAVQYFVEDSPTSSQRHRQRPGRQHASRTKKAPRDGCPEGLGIDRPECGPTLNPADAFRRKHAACQNACRPKENVMRRQLLRGNRPKMRGGLSSEISAAVAIAAGVAPRLATMPQAREGLTRANCNTAGEAWEIRCGRVAYVFLCVPSRSRPRVRGNAARRR